MTNKRAIDRREMALPARLTWKDQRGTTRFASVVTRNVSEQGVYVECTSAVPITLYRLVQFQLEREARSKTDDLPYAFRQARVLSAVYRMKSPRPGERQGLALRLLVDPRHAVQPVAARATA